MKVCFLLNDLGLSGGVGAVATHARNLVRLHGFDVTLALTGEPRSAWEYDGLEGVRVRRIADITDERFAIAVATWWETAYSLMEVKAERYAYFVQNTEDRFYGPNEPNRVLAGLTFELPAAFITEAKWIAAVLAEWHPDSPRYYVRNGVAKHVFMSPSAVEPRLQQPLRVVIEGHPKVWFKAVDEAISAVGMMREAKHVTAIVPDSTGGAVAGADQTLGPLKQAELAAVYEQSDVVLKLSRVEGMFGPPLEAFHMGATCVVTPVTGHEEYIRHRWNGLVSDWDDTAGTARWLDTLARDRRLLHRLRYNALLTARGWPSWEQSSQFMAAALRSIARHAAVRGTPFGGLAQHTRTRMEEVNNEVILLRDTLRLGEEKLAHTEEMLRIESRRLQDIRESKTYRLAIGLRRLRRNALVEGLTRVLNRLRVLPRRSA